MEPTFRPTRRAILTAAAAGLATASIAGLPVATHAAPGRGGRLIYGRNADSLFLDPVPTETNVDIWVMTNLYDTLLAPTDDGSSLQPGLATKWELTDAGKSLVFTLREGVRFADGTPMKASDVKWSLDRARKMGPAMELIASIDAIEITNPATITIRLKHPDPSILAALGAFNTAILPQAAFEATPGANDEDKAKAYFQHPVGTGPFMLGEWKHGVSMILKKNPYYWKHGADGKPLPYLDEVEFQVLPDDVTRLLKLKAGELHGAEFVPYSRVKELQADPSLRVELWPSTRLNFLRPNCRPTQKDGMANPMSSVKVRQALNHAVNKDAIIAVTTLGLGKPMRSFISSATPLFHGEDLYPYDVAKAKALLAEAGFAQGFDVSCQMLAGNQERMSNLTLVQQMWSAVGVRLKIEQLEMPTVIARLRAGNFAMQHGYWTDDISDPSEITAYFAYSPTADCQHTGWKDGRVEELFVASQQEVDRAKRAAQYKAIQEVYAAAAPIVFLYETPYAVAWRKNVKGFVQIPLGNNIFETTYIEN